MHFIKFVSLTIAHLAKEAWSLPHRISQAFTLRRQRRERAANEVERLDRIRNPSKYRGI